MSIDREKETKCIRRSYNAALGKSNTSGHWEFLENRGVTFIWQDKEIIR